ncbi:MAG: YceD family protein, partial [Oscillospiraceae bacterium]
MLVNLSKIFQREETQKQLDLEFDFKDEDVCADAKFTQPVKARVNLEKSRGQTSVKLTVSAKAECSCARCLKLFEREFDFSQEFSVTPDILTQSEPIIPVSSDNILDIKQLVLQELTLEIPTVLLCRENCP